MKVTFSLALVLITLSGYCQNGTNLKQEFVYYSYDQQDFERTANDVDKEFIPSLELGDSENLKAVDEIILGKEMLISLDSWFDDKMKIFINDKLVKSRHFRTNEMLEYTDSFKINLTPEQQILRVELPDKKVFAEVLIDPRYKILYLYYREKDPHVKWTALYSNYYRIYE